MKVRHSLTPRIRGLSWRTADIGAIGLRGVRPNKTLSPRTRPQSRRSSKTPATLQVPHIAPNKALLTANGCWKALSIALLTALSLSVLQRPDLVRRYDVQDS